MKVQNPAQWEKTKKGEKKLCIEVLNMWDCPDIEVLLLAKRTLTFFASIDENLGKGRFDSKKLLRSDLTTDLKEVFKKLGYEIINP